MTVKLTGVRLDHDWFDRPLPHNVEIGERSWLYSSYAFIHYRSERPVGVKIGRESGVYHSSHFELGPDGELRIGDYCSVVGAIIASNGLVVIEDYSFIAHQVVLADTFAPTPPVDCTSSGPLDRAEEPRIFLGENTWVGARALLLRGAHIGKGSIVGAGAVVDFKVPPYSVMAGNPGRIVGSVARTNPGSTGPGERCRT
jgi:acetyltransferase-like isoleucine patch superfamily enzyme